MPRLPHVHLLQHRLHPAHPQHARDAARALAQVAQPGDMLVLCELFSTGFRFDRADLLAQAPLDQAFLESLSKDTQCVVLGGHALPTPKGLANALSVYHNGSLLTRYAKLHLFGPGGEATCFTPGDSLPLFRWPSTGLLVQPAICYDLRFPELFVAGRAAGAEMIALASAWPSVREHHWRTLLAARAIECQALVAACNALGECPAPRPAQDGARAPVPHPGASLVLSHLGEVLADAQSEACVVSAPVDASAIRGWRERFAVFADRRALPYPIANA